MSTGGGNKAIFAALAANLGIAVSKFVAFIITGSSSMLAESIHSFADTGNQGLLLLGGKRAQREADAAHPFGYGRDRYFYAFVVALVLFSLGSLFALYEGYEKVRHPHELESAVVAIGVLLVAIALESYSLRTAISESNQVRPAAMSWWDFIRRAKAPELPVVLLEDCAALLGLAFALVGVTLALVLDAPVWDGIGTLAIGLLLGAVAVILAVEMKSLLIGESASVAEINTLSSALTAGGDVRRIIHLKTMHLGPEELLVAAKVELAPGLDLAGVADAIDDAERRAREAVPIARVIYLEPDLYREDYVPARPVGAPESH